MCRHTNGDAKSAWNIRSFTTECGSGAAQIAATHGPQKYKNEKGVLMPYERYYGLNRTLCAVLDAMRKLNETRNYGPLASLVEEAQIMADRMEAALIDVKDVKTLHEERKKLLEEVRALRADKKALKNEDKDEKES
jgi:hypothetical protein